MRRMTIDRAVEWAYREELPKSRDLGGNAVFGFGLADASGGFSAMQTLGTLPDNIFGVVVDPYAVTEPAEEAFAIHEAVARLEDVDVGFPAAWDVADGFDFGACHTAVMGRAEAVISSMSGTALVDLVRRVAILGAYDCELDDYEVHPIKTKNGMPRWFRKVLVSRPTCDGGEVKIEVEADGYNPKSHRPYDDAYLKFIVDPDPTEALVNRARMELWRAAMDLIFDDLGSSIGCLELEPCRLPARPWDAASPRVLDRVRPALSPARAQRQAPRQACP